MARARAPLPFAILAAALGCSSCHGAPPATPPTTVPGEATEAPVSVAIPELSTEVAATAPPAEDAVDDDAPAPGITFESNAATASKYARLGREACEAELGARKIAYTRVEDAKGVIAPLRLDGPLSGVTFRSNLPASQSRTSPYDIYDCRLVLALDDFAGMLAKHDIVEVVHLSVYRPVGSKVTLKNGVGRRHSGALAIDAALFKTKDGKTLSVLKDFKGRIGTKPCPAPATATELRKIACEANDARLFNVLLTPDYNWAHRNHFHMEVTAGVPWTLVR